MVGPAKSPTTTSLPPHRPSPSSKKRSPTGPRSRSTLSSTPIPSRPFRTTMAVRVRSLFRQACTSDLTLTVIKETLPDGATQSFDFELDTDPFATLQDNDGGSGAIVVSAGVHLRSDPHRHQRNAPRRGHAVVRL